MIFRVPIDILTDSLWDEIAPLLESALYGTPTHTIDDVKAAILANEALLMVQSSEQRGRVEAALTVQIIDFPQGKWLSVWLVGAHPDCKLDTVAALTNLDLLRVANGCRGIQSPGARLGWMRKIPGVRLEGHSMRLTME